VSHVSWRTRSIAAPAVLTLALLTMGSASAAAGTERAAAAPVVGLGDRTAIKDRYIVVFRNSATIRSVQSARTSAQGKGAAVHHVYASALKGFAATLPSSALSALRNNPDVAYVEVDRSVRIADTQTPATWGLDRIDQRDLPLNNTYTYNATGVGVNAYIIDTGIRKTHTQFGGRAVDGFDAIDGGPADDCNGHGTHVAGTVGSSTYGVAKQVKLFAVRVLNCQGSGSTSQVVAGIDWVTANHVKPAVANMSLGGGASTALDNATANSIAAGVSYAIAAGNSNQNACNFSPARVATAMTVGSTTSTDARSSFSNFGSCLDLFAPGSSITSTWSTSDTAINTISGTSMATPHVAGVAALYLQGSPTASPATVRNAIVNAATSNKVTNPGTGSPNKLLYSLFGATPPPPPPGCSLPETYSGTLSGPGDRDYQPGGGWFYMPRSGLHRGCLTGPSTANFDIFLHKWNGSSWPIVARGTAATSTEDVSYTGTPGYYYWEVWSRTGSGAYTFQMQRP
jgi:subtilisin family serine protease